MPDKGEYPIKLGRLLFTMVEPTHSSKSSMQPLVRARPLLCRMHGRTVTAGDEFVATRQELEDLRYPTESDMTPDPLTGSYLTIYWVLNSHRDKWNRWASTR